MTIPSDIAAESSGVTAPGYNNAPTRPFYWSVLRELWENRSIYVAPLSVAGIILFGSLVAAFHLPGLRRSSPSIREM